MIIAPRLERRNIGGEKGSTPGRSGWNSRRRRCRIVAAPVLTMSRPARMFAGWPAMYQVEGGDGAGRACEGQHLSELQVHDVAIHCIDRRGHVGPDLVGRRIRPEGQKGVVG